MGLRTPFPQQRRHSQKSPRCTPRAPGLPSLHLTLGRPRLSTPCLLQDRHPASPPCHPSRSHLGTWLRPPAGRSRLGRCTRRSPRCCGSGRHRAGGSGSTRPRLWRPVQVPAGQGRLVESTPPPPGAPPITPPSSWTGRVVPSQVIMGPGSKPSAQAHSKPPMTLVQVPSPQGCPTEHSSVSGGGEGGGQGPSAPQLNAAGYTGPGPVSGPDAGQARAGCWPERASE